MNLNEITKPFRIVKQQVWDAYKRVCVKGGAAGVDGQSIEDFNKEGRHIQGG